MVQRSLRTARERKGTSGLTELAAVEEQWDQLAERVAAPPFARPGWIGAWWRAFGAGRLEIVTVPGAAGLGGVLPLARRRGVVRSTANWHTPLFEPVLEEPEVAPRMARAVLARSGRRLDLSLVAAEAPAIAECCRAAR